MAIECPECGRMSTELENNGQCELCGYCEYDILDGVL